MWEDNRIEIVRVFQKTKHAQSFLSRIVQSLTTRIRIRPNDGNGSLKREIEYSFRRQLDRLRFAGGLHASADSRSCGTADGSALASTRDGADDAANNGAAANFFRSVRTTRTAFLAVLVGLDVVGFSIGRDGIELQH